MNRRVWTGIVAGVLAATVLLAVGIGSYRAGQDDEVVTRTATAADGEVVRVVENDRDFFPGFLIFPLLVVGLVFVVARGRRRHGWHGPYGHGWHGPGPYGPGSYGAGPCGPGGPGGGPDARMREWHRRMHEEDVPSGEAGTGNRTGPGDGGTAPQDAGPAPRVSAPGRR